MIINELMMNQDSRFTDIQCKMAIKQKIVAKNGRVEMIGDNQFKFITKDHLIDTFIVLQMLLVVVITLKREKCFFFI